MFSMIVRHPRFNVVCIAIACAGGALVATRSRADASPGRYVIKPGSTVLDTKTKLLWQQDVAPAFYSWGDAALYCKKLQLEGLEWRLPGMKELETLVDENRTNPAIDPTAFPDTPAKFFWTASLVTSFPSSGWTVDFNRGADNFFPTNTSQLVRCVH